MNVLDLASTKKDHPTASAESQLGEKILFESVSTTDGRGLTPQHRVDNVERLVGCRLECSCNGNKWHCPTPHAWIWPLTTGKLFE